MVRKLFAIATVVIIYGGTAIVTVSGLLALRDRADAPTLWIVTALVGWVLLSSYAYELTQTRKKLYALQRKRIESGNEGVHYQESD